MDMRDLKLVGGARRFRDRGRRRSSLPSRPARRADAPPDRWLQHRRRPSYLIGRSASPARPAESEQGASTARSAPGRSRCDFVPERGRLEFCGGDGVARLRLDLAAIVDGTRLRLSLRDRRRAAFLRPRPGRPAVRSARRDAAALELPRRPRPGRRHRDPAAPVAPRLRALLRQSARRLCRRRQVARPALPRLRGRGRRASTSTSRRR